jgi:hypothetical protein
MIDVDGVTIYLSEPDDAIARLAQLDSTRRPSCAVLVAAVAGDTVAALPLDGGPAIADPFHPTPELVSLLEVRLAQLTSPPRRPRPVRLLEALWLYPRPHEPERTNRSHHACALRA